jgi:hypothetical protein
MLFVFGGRGNDEKFLVSDSSPHGLLNLWLFASLWVTLWFTEGLGTFGSSGTSIDLCVTVV